MIPWILYHVSSGIYAQFFQMFVMIRGVVSVNVNEVTIGIWYLLFYDI